MFIEEKIVYFQKTGIENTEKTLELAISEALELPSKTLLISSTTGYSAKTALEMMAQTQKINLVVVGHRFGFKEMGKNEFDLKTEEELKRRGFKIFFGTHFFTGIEKALSLAYGGIYPHRMIGDTFKIFSQGTKVLFEDMIMASDSGLIPVNDWIVSAGGTGRGLDTAMVIKSVNSDHLFHTRIKKILCIPGEFD